MEDFCAYFPDKKEGSQPVIISRQKPVPPPVQLTDTSNLKGNVDVAREELQRPWNRWERAPPSPRMSRQVSVKQDPTLGSQT